MMEYSVQKLKEFRGELDDLIWLHWEEIALNKDQINLDPDWDKYEEGDRNGQIVWITCRHKGILVGYSSWFLTKHLHYKNHTWAYNDIVYLKKEHRRGRNGLDLIRYSEYVMKLLGADKIAWHVKSTHDWTPILRRMGYGLEDMTMGKVV